MPTIIKKNVLILMVLAFILPLISAPAEAKYGRTLCKLPEYECIKIRRHQSWARLFPNPEDRDIVRRINRMNTGLYPGLVIAVPKNLAHLNVYDVSPFPRYIDPPGEKVIYVSQRHLAFGAYDAGGELVWWGPISSGKNYCPDVREKCNTPGGEYRIIRKQGIECVSTAFPKRPDGNHGGAPMPYCMHFYRGYAFHGSTTVPGRRDSHGCIRLFTEDAKWLNTEFITLPGNGNRGTRVIIEEVSSLI